MGKKIDLLVMTGALLALIGLHDSPAHGFANSAPSFDCMTCHQGETGDEAVQLRNMSGTYTPGKTYTLTLVVESGLKSMGEVQGGFALEASAGELIVLDDKHTQLSNGFLTHTMEGARKRTWKFGWKAPQAKTAVDITVMAVAANGDYSSTGDRVGADSFAMQPGK